MQQDETGTLSPCDQDLSKVKRRSNAVANFLDEIPHW
jgi:hypothetical protein